MLHAFIQTQSSPSTAELRPITSTLRRTLALIDDLGISCEAVPAVALSSVLRSKIVTASTCARALLHCHAVVAGLRDGEDAVVYVVSVATLVAVVGNGRIAWYGDVGVGLEDCHAVGSTAELR